jgi:hypothetical protein
VSVVTRGTSDDANGADLTVPEVWLQIYRAGNVFGMHYALDGRIWRMVRLFRLDVPERIKVGLVAQCPAGQEGDRLLVFLRRGAYGSKPASGAMKGLIRSNAGLDLSKGMNDLNPTETFQELLREEWDLRMRGDPPRHDDRDHRFNDRLPGSCGRRISPGGWRARRHPPQAGRHPASRPPRRRTVELRYLPPPARVRHPRA